MVQLSQQGDPRVISYLTLRKAVGYLGTLLPFVLAIGNWLIFSSGLPDSLSDYHHTGMRDVLVGALTAIGASLLSYHGYDRWDTLVSNAAGVGAIGTALFPTAPDHPSAAAAIAGYFHFGFATVMFAALIVMDLWLFRKTGPDSWRNPRKRIRDRVYLAAGLVMIVALALAGLSALPFAAPLAPLHPVFWLESIAIVAFGISWLVKGQAILPDTA